MGRIILKTLKRLYKDPENKRDAIKTILKKVTNLVKKTSGTEYFYSKELKDISERAPKTLPPEEYEIIDIKNE